MQIVVVLFEFFFELSEILEKYLRVNDVLNSLELVISILNYKLIAFRLSEIVSVYLLIHF